MEGGPSHIDTFDPKPYLYKHNGEPLPIKRPLAFDDSEAGPLMQPQWEFKPGGKSGDGPQRRPGARRLAFGRGQMPARGFR